jgi:hypothetical protein
MRSPSFTTASAGTYPSSMTPASGELTLMIRIIFYVPGKIYDLRRAEIIFSSFDIQD